MNEDRKRAILSVVRRAYPQETPVHVGGQSPGYFVILNSSDGLRLVLGHSTKGKPLDIQRPTIIRTDEGIPHRHLMRVHLHHARRFAPPASSTGPLFTHLLALHNANLTRTFGYARLAHRLHAHVPDVEEHLAWTALWRHLHARQQLSKGQTWHDGHEVVTITRVSTHTLDYQAEQASTPVTEGQIKFLESFMPVRRAPVTLPLTRKPWNPAWTNIT